MPGHFGPRVTTGLVIHPGAGSLVVPAKPSGTNPGLALTSGEKAKPKAIIVAMTSDLDNVFIGQPPL